MACLPPSAPRALILCGILAACARGGGSTGPSVLDAAIAPRDTPGSDAPYRRDASDSRDAPAATGDADGSSRGSDAALAADVRDAATAPDLRAADAATTGDASDAPPGNDGTPADGPRATDGAPPDPAQMQWTARNSGTTNSLFSVTWVNNQAVVFGRGGPSNTERALLTSPDGVAWTRRESQWELRGVTWTGSRYVAVGSKENILTPPRSVGLVVTSSDGVVWKAGASGLGNPYLDALTDVAWTGTQLVAVGRSSAILTSPDGESWTTRTRTPPLVGSYTSLVSTGSQLVVVGWDEGSGYVQSAILTSPDGIQWEERNPGIRNALASVTWTGRQLVAVGQKGLVLTSPDGVTWTPRTSGTTSYLTSVAWTGSQLVAVGDPRVVLSSPDGITWTDQTPSVRNLLGLHSVTWTGERLIAVGNYGIILTSP